MSSTTTDATNTSLVGATTDDQMNAASRRAAGEFVRGVSAARGIISNEAGAEFPAEANRYHLIVALNCPWCHRVCMVRSVLGLEDAVSVDVLFPGRTTADDPRGEDLWRFAPEGVVCTNKRHVSFPECTAGEAMAPPPGTAGGGKQDFEPRKYVVDIYADSGLVQKSVPILYDKVQQCVVNNESSEIMRMFETVMLPFAKQRGNHDGPLDLYPAELRAKIDETNDWIYADINNGAYKAGFSSDQTVYEKAFGSYFEGIERIEKMLGENRRRLAEADFESADVFLLGPRPTDSDVRAFATLWRQDPIYHNRMKLNKAWLWEFPEAWLWMDAMMRLEGMGEIAGTRALEHAKQGYFGRTGNGVVPIGPVGYPECYGKPYGGRNATASNDE